MDIDKFSKKICNQIKDLVSKQCNYTLFRLSIDIITVSDGFSKLLKNQQLTQISFQVISLPYSNEFPVSDG